MRTKPASACRIFVAKPWRICNPILFPRLSLEALLMKLPISINRQVEPLVRSLSEQAWSLRIVESPTEEGVWVVDAGINAIGGIEAGRQIAEICMGGMGQATLTYGGSGDWPLTIHVHTQHPVLACLASQYAGWSLSDKESGFHALGSGPARSMAQREELFGKIGYKDSYIYTTLVMEVDKVPPRAVREKICEDCGVEPFNLTLILTPTTSLAGTVQVVGRVLEVGLHKAHELGFDLNCVVDGIGSAPIPPLDNSDTVRMMGRTNDAILFGGQIKLFVQSSDEEAERLATELPSSTSRDYGKPFATVFKEHDYDFFQIDPMLFSPARVLVNNIRTGRSFSAGTIDLELLEQSFKE